MRPAGGQLHPPGGHQGRRDVIRYRAKIVQPRTSEVQRLGNVLRDAGIKIDSVASSIVTKAGRSMIESLIDGERRPEVLAELAIGRMRPKIPDLAMALEGRFGEHHALMCRLHLDHIDHLAAMTARLDAQIEAMMAPFRAARALLTTIPGIGPLAAAAVISETGPGVREFFPGAAHLASWAGMCPGNHESAGKHRSGKRRKGNQHLQPVLAECAWAAVRHDGYLKSLPSARHEMGRVPLPARHEERSRLPLWGRSRGVAHAMIVIIWHVLATGKPYAELGKDYFSRRADPERETRRLVQNSKLSGHTVTLEAAA